MASVMISGEGTFDSLNLDYRSTSCKLSPNFHIQIITLGQCVCAYTQANLEMSLLLLLWIKFWGRNQFVKSLLRAERIPGRLFICNRTYQGSCTRLPQPPQCWVTGASIAAKGCPSPFSMTLQSCVSLPPFNCSVIITQSWLVCFRGKASVF